MYVAILGRWLKKTYANTFFKFSGREFVSGSYDKTVRIFPVEKGRSREVYHTKRMQRLSCVSWSRDNRFILSGIYIFRNSKIDKNLAKKLFFCTF